MAAQLEDGPPPDYRMAQRIVVDQYLNGSPRVTIDGETLPWYTAGVTVPAPSSQELPTVTVTFLANHVELVNEARPPLT